MLQMEPMSPITDQNVEVICIASPESISRESCIHASIPLSRDGRQPSFTAHRLQRRKTRHGRWDFTKLIIQINVGMSNEIDKFHSMKRTLQSAMKKA